MKKNAIIYWTSTGIIAFIMLASAYYFCFSDEAKEAFAHLGYPDYFRVELTIAKTLGGLAVLIPVVPGKIKEFAYFGIGITVISAIVWNDCASDGKKYARTLAAACAVAACSDGYDGLSGTVTAVGRL